MTPAEQIARLPRTAPDEGRPVSPDTIDKLRARYEAARAAGTPRGEWLINVAAQARHALAADGSSLGYHMGGETGQRTERRWHITALKQDFGGEAACLRWNPEERCWLLKRSQFDALCAGYGDRLEVAPEAWRLLFPAKQKRNGDAR